jgi:hypothetical protein
MRSAIVYYFKPPESISCSVCQGKMDNGTIGIIIFFIVSSYLGHILLHRVIKTPAQYERPKVAMVDDGSQYSMSWIETATIQ